VSIVPQDPASNPAPRRKPIPKRVRFEVLRRDNYTCRYCRSTENELTIDHVVPTVLGGSDDPANLVAACKDCNAGKASSSPDAPLVAQVSDDAVRWAAAMKLAAERRGVSDEALLSRLSGIRDYWYEVIPGYRHQQPKWRLPTDWNQHVAQLLTAGMPDAMVMDSIDVASTARGNIDNAFRYMLGVAKNKLAGLQEDARQLLATGIV
jgi:hypothetical protein